MKPTSYAQLMQAYQRACSTLATMSSNLEGMTALASAQARAMSDRRSLALGLISPSRLKSQVEADARAFVVARRKEAAERAAKPKLTVVNHVL